MGNVLHGKGKKVNLQDCSWSGRLILLYKDWESCARYDSETGGYVESIEVSDDTAVRAVGPEERGITPVVCGLGERRRSSLREQVMRTHGA